MKMNLTLWFPSFVIFVHLFRRISCDMDLEALKVAIACDDVGIVKKFLEGEYKERVLHEALIETEEKERLMEEMEMSRMQGIREYRRPDSRPLLLRNGALHRAVEYRALGVTRLLLENGANVDILNNVGNTPLLIAAKRNVSLDTSHDKDVHEKVIDTLLEFNADIHIKDDYDSSPLMTAVSYPNNVSLVAKLLARGGNINDNSSWLRQTPLLTAVLHGSAEVAKFLLDNGAEADANTIYGENSLHIIFNTKNSYWLRQTGRKNQAAIAKLLLKLENAENMLQQREIRHLKTPVDIFFEQSDPNRDILVDLLKTLSSLDDAYAVSALRIFSSSLEEDSPNWPLDNFPEYVRTAFNSYIQIFYKDKTEESFHPNAFTKDFSENTSVHSISPTHGIKHFMENSLYYSLYVILKTYFRIHRERYREEAAEEVKKFDEYLSEISLPFQNALSKAIAKGSTLGILPADILMEEIFLRSNYAPCIQRFAKIMSLIQFTRRWSVEEMVDAAPEFIYYIQQEDILL